MLAHASILPAAFSAAPAVAEMETTLATGYVRLHSTAAGWLPEGDVKARLRVTVPPEFAVAEDKESELAWARQAGAEPK